MTEVDDTALRSIPEQERSEMALRVADETFDILFDHAPMMIHAIDEEGRMIKVNDRWLRRLGYKRDEVLGRKSTEFLTEESRQRAIKDTLPLFWRVGSARSVGYQFVRKNGRIIDVLLDAELGRDNSGTTFTIATLREGHDPMQWKQAVTIIKALKQLASAHTLLQRTLLAEEGVNQDPGSPEAQRLSSFASANSGETLEPFLEHTESISVNLRALLRVHEEWLDASAEQQRELLGVAKSIEKSLAYLADTAADRPKSE